MSRPLGIAAAPAPRSEAGTWSMNARQIPAVTAEVRLAGRLGMRSRRGGDSFPATSGESFAPPQQAARLRGADRPAAREPRDASTTPSGVSLIDDGSAPSRIRQAPPASIVPFRPIRAHRNAARTPTAPRRLSRNRQDSRLCQEVIHL